MKHNKKPSFGFARKTIFTLGSVFVFFVILVILFRKFPHVSDLRENLLSKDLTVPSHQQPASLNSGLLKVPIRNSFKKYSGGLSGSSSLDNKLRTGMFCVF